MPIEANHGVERCGEFCVPVPDQVGEPAPGLLQVAGQVPRELGGPLAGRVPGDAEQVYAPCPEFDDERDV